MNNYYINTNELNSKIHQLRAGDKVMLSGTVFTARDAAHKRLIPIINEGGKLPFNLKNSAIYYAGPTPTPLGLAIGSCGPTTSSRMDSFTPTLLENGVKCMIGKGPRNSEVLKSIIENGAIYLCAIGGAGALAAKCITNCDVIAFDELGCESIKKLEFKDFPLIVGIDRFGGTLFETNK